MKKLFATSLIVIAMIAISASSLFSLDIEFNASYDYFRSLPDGSWNGNQGGVVAANAGFDIADGLCGQLGGSFGLYNWDGRQNLVFTNPKSPQQQIFLTAGLSAFCEQWNIGVAYDRQFVKHLSIYDVSTSLDQIRFQGGYQFCEEEVGLWGTTHLSRVHKDVIGIPISYRAISQLNAYWIHYFPNCASTTIWLGAPYQDGLRFRKHKPGVFIAGFAVRAPLTDHLFVDGHGSYMCARSTPGIRQSRNYAANINLGITYVWGDCCYGATYMPLANNSNFLIDISTNQ